jgi:hypothetical protein
MSFLKVSSLFIIFMGLALHAEEVTYNCILKLHCSLLHEDQSVLFQYQSRDSKKEVKNVDLGYVRARVYGPHYLSLYLFDTRHPQTIWTKAHSNSFINDLEISLVIPEDSDHTMVANLRCEKQN